MRKSVTTVNCLLECGCRSPYKYDLNYFAHDERIIINCVQNTIVFVYHHTRGTTSEFLIDCYILPDVKLGLRHPHSSPHFLV